MVAFSQNVRSGLAVRTVVDSSGPNGTTSAAYGVISASSEGDHAAMGPISSLMVSSVPADS